MEYFDQIENDDFGTSLILLVKDKGMSFICNRNLSEFSKYYFNDKYMKWLGISKGWYLEEIASITDKRIQILEFVPVSNKRLKDQKILNVIKRKYIEMYNVSNNNNEGIGEELCNSLFNEHEKNIRRNCKIIYEEVCNDVENLLKSKKLYEIFKKCWFNYRQIINNYTREEIWNSKELTLDEKCVLMYFKSYFKIRINKNEYLPINKNQCKKINQFLRYLVTELKNQMKMEYEDILDIYNYGIKYINNSFDLF